MTDRHWGMFLSVAVHAMIVGLGTFLLVSPLQYQMRTGGDISVELTGSEPEVAVRSHVLIPPLPATIPESVSDPDGVVEKTTQSVATAAPVQAQKSDETMGGATGGGPGQGSGTATAKPLYLENPPPAYPERARRLGQEGVVLLAVTVTPAGTPRHVDLKKTSGYPLLDNAAISSVRRWRFRAATVAGIPVETMVDVPVRFKLQ